jgi:hypothetical protein
MSDALLTAYLVPQFQTLRALFIAGTGVYFGFKYQHWPMKRTFFVAREIVSAVLYPYNLNKTNAQKLEIFTNKSMFTSTGGPTDVPRMVLGYSVGVVG